MTRTVTLAGYVAIAAAAVALEVVARRARRRPGPEPVAHATPERGRPVRRAGGVGTFSSVLAAVLGRPIVGAVVMAAWLWLGWHVFVRVDWR